MRIRISKPLLVEPLEQCHQQFVQILSQGDLDKLKEQLEAKNSEIDKNKNEIHQVTDELKQINLQLKKSSDESSPQLKEAINNFLFLGAKITLGEDNNNYPSEEVDPSNNSSGVIQSHSDEHKEKKYFNIDTVKKSIEKIQEKIPLLEKEVNRLKEKKELFDFEKLNKEKQLEVASQAFKNYEQELKELRSTSPFKPNSHRINRKIELYNKMIECEIEFKKENPFESQILTAKSEITVCD